ncbi:lysozyme inhibitor LprI family protein [Pseudomonas putida]|uniref:lysozyme inhibitor LprI family protein n=1 Tax=Pseudomonas putida TaxID=303 RepID=UPI002365E988|nr:lysozyme inhibitor LprI family protein [Pseudomonas putida]MDD2048921.1 lysozyme inhibitor LprI family protein [Pseudomonas putida]
MKHRLLTIALLTAISPFAVAQGDSPAYSQCMQTAQSTLDMNNCNGAEIKHQDARLNGAYKKAMTALEPAQQAQLRDAQRLWIKYRDTNCKLYYSLTGGTIDQLNGAGCVLDMTKARANELSSLSESR